MASKKARGKQDLAWLREVCLALPGTTEDLKWGADVVFSVGDKMYCKRSAQRPLGRIDGWSRLAGTGTRRCAAGAMGEGYSFRCEPPVQEALIQRPDIVFAPYLGKHGWVRVQTWTAIEPAEAAHLVGVSYRLVLAKLPKKLQRALNPELAG
jgi:predicted DNA-binding protein (MmcQ/YjbR family)